MCACCFIELVKHKTGKSLEQGRENEVWFVDSLLMENFDGEIEVYTSTLSVAECTHAANDISEEVQELFVRFLISGQYLTLIEPDVFVAEDARDLKWKHKISLSGADALHVASALSMECKEFLTIDEKRKGPIHQADKIRALGMAVIKPSQTGLLSDKYRQNNFQGISHAPQSDKPLRGKPKKP